jgi:hypothetical protein
VTIELAARVEEPRRGGGDAAADVDSGALAQKPPGLQSDRTQKVDLQLDRGVPDTGGKHGVHGATHRRIEEGARKAPVHHTERIVVVLGGRAHEQGTALLYLKRLEAHELCYGRRGLLAGEDRPQEG